MFLHFLFFLHYSSCVLRCTICFLCSSSCPSCSAERICQTRHCEPAFLSSRVLRLPSLSSCLSSYRSFSASLPSRTSCSRSRSHATSSCSHKLFASHEIALCHSLILSKLPSHCRPNCPSLPPLSLDPESKFSSRFHLLPGPDGSTNSASSELLLRPCSKLSSSFHCETHRQTHRHTHTHTHT